MGEQEAFSQQIKQLSPSQGDLLVISVPNILTQDQLQKIQVSLQAQAEQLGYKTLVVYDGITAQLQPSIADLLAEQQKQTALLEKIAGQNLDLIVALSEGDSDDAIDALVPTYLNGSPIRGGA